jgi:hypothetical protein
MGKGKTMKTPITIVLMSCCVLGGVWAMAANEPQSPKPSELEDLKDRVKALEDKVATLEKQLRVGPRVPRTPTLPQLPRGRQVPEGWLPREFNGIPYYVIPIEQDPNGALPRK